MRTRRLRGWNRGERELREKGLLEPMEECGSGLKETMVFHWHYFLLVWSCSHDKWFPTEWMLCFTYHPPQWNTCFKNSWPCSRQNSFSCQLCTGDHGKCSVWTWWQKPSSWNKCCHSGMRMVLINCLVDWYHLYILVPRMGFWIISNLVFKEK